MANEIIQESAPPIAPGGAMPPEEGGGTSQRRAEEQVQAFLETMPEEQVVEIATMDAAQVMDVLIHMLVAEAGIPEEEAASYARMFYTEVITLAQELTDMTLEELQAMGGQVEDATGGMEAPDSALPPEPRQLTPPEPSIAGGF